MSERLLFIFGLVITFLGWYATGYQLKGPGLGIGLGLAGVAVVGICMLRIEEQV